MSSQDYTNKNRRPPLTAVSGPEDAAKELALSSAKVRPHVEGKEIRKSIYVPGRLVNLVVG